MWDREKMLITDIFSFSHIVFLPYRAHILSIHIQFVFCHPEFSLNYKLVDEIIKEDEICVCLKICFSQSNIQSWYLVLEL